jgi:hypothetical protein
MAFVALEAAIPLLAEAGEASAVLAAETAEMGALGEATASFSSGIEAIGTSVAEVKNSIFMTRAVKIAGAYAVGKEVYKGLKNIGTELSEVGKGISGIGSRIFGKKKKNSKRKRSVEERENDLQYSKRMGKKMKEAHSQAHDSVGGTIDEVHSVGQRMDGSYKVHRILSENPKSKDLQNDPGYTGDLHSIPSHGFPLTKSYNTRGDTSQSNSVQTWNSITTQLPSETTAAVGVNSIEQGSVLYNRMLNDARKVESITSF